MPRAGVPAVVGVVHVAGCGADVGGGRVDCRAPAGAGPRGGMPAVQQPGAAIGLYVMGGCSWQPNPCAVIENSVSREARRQ